MSNKPFKKMDIVEKISFLNEKLNQGYTVSKIREVFNIPEKYLQNEVKLHNYKYDFKLKQYIPKKSTTESTTESTTNNSDITVVDKNTIVVQENQVEVLEYIESNFEILKEFIEKYKSTTRTNKEVTAQDIIIDLIDDKHLNPKPKSVRINEHVYKDWQKFCAKNKYYSKQDLISMALKEYMEKH